MFFRDHYTTVCDKESIRRHFILEHQQLLETSRGRNLSIRITQARMSRRRGKASCHFPPGKHPGQAAEMSGSGSVCGKLSTNKMLVFVGWQGSLVSYHRTENSTVFPINVTFCSISAFTLGGTTPKHARTHAHTCPCSHTPARWVSSSHTGSLQSPRL